MTKHECKRAKLVWEETPHVETESVYFVGRCPTCGKEYQQVFVETDGLWDETIQEYVFI